MKLILRFLIIILLLSQTFALSASKKKQEIKSFSLFNGKFNVRNYDIREFKLFNGGKSFLIWFNNKKNDKLHYVQVNNKIYGPFFIFSCPPVISKNKKGYAFGYEKNNKLYLLVNGKTHGPVNIENFYKCYFSENLSHFGFKYEKGKYSFINIDGKNHGPITSDFFDFHSVDLALSEDGQFAFTFPRDKKQYVQFNSSLLGPYDYVKSLMFLGNNLFFLYEKDNKGFAKWGEKTYGPYDPFYY